MTKEKYRYEAGHVYRLTLCGTAYVHCFRCPAHWSKAKAIKAYESAGAESQQNPK